MNEKIYLKNLFSESNRTTEENLELFALLNLGILESLNHGLMSATDALRTFFMRKTVCLSASNYVIGSLMKS